MAAPAHLLLSALSDTALSDTGLPYTAPNGTAPSKPGAEPYVPASPEPLADHALPAESRLYAFGAEGAGAEVPLTSEPPLPDAEPLTSEPPLAETAPLTSESAAEFADPDPRCTEL
ncbi:hypothetical protein ACH4UM_16430 [Streptomyces sp. NPDC020801]|uniref:hypothetical protein n=1 Tax=unclassified Streptomyces TaxID=2593676 RepID=UPI0037A0B852